MPPDLKKLPMVLPCEWQGCGLTKDNIHAFLRHVNKHVNDLLPEGTTAENYKNYTIEPRQDELCCEWTDCNFTTTDGEVTLIRHLYFHAYHTKIKWWANQEQAKNDFGQCILGSATRNLIPDLPEGFVCYWKECQFYTDNAEHFYRHADNHGLVEDPVVVCGAETFPCCWEGCESVTKTKYKLAEHLRSHTQEKRFACAECGSLFSNRAKFIDHVARQIALELQNYQCSHCSKIFASERLLRDHMRHHVNHYKCPSCDMTCTNPSMLKAHVKWKHTTERPFQCDLCHHSCKSVSSLRKHRHIHSASTMMMCDEAGCKYTAFALSTMKKHMLRHHSDEHMQPYVCHVCGMRYSCGATLTRHLKVKHKFKWPSGHSRFRYKKQQDGLYRLQTVRYESLELTEQILKEKQQEVENCTVEKTNSNGIESMNNLDTEVAISSEDYSGEDEMPMEREGEAVFMSCIGTALMKDQPEGDSNVPTDDSGESSVAMCSDASNMIECDGVSNVAMQDVILMDTVVVIPQSAHSDPVEEVTYMVYE